MPERGHAEAGAGIFQQPLDDGPLIAGLKIPRKRMCASFGAKHLLWVARVLISVE
jgi:hypothetical protein